MDASKPMSADEIAAVRERCEAIDEAIRQQHMRGDCHAAIMCAAKAVPRLLATVAAREEQIRQARRLLKDVYDHNGYASFETFAAIGAHLRKNGGVV